MSNKADKSRKRYLDHTEDILKLTCHIHGPGHSSYECKVLVESGTEYAKGRPTKDHRQEPATKKKIGIQQEKNAIIQHAVDDIISQENKKLSVKDETHVNIDDEFDKDDLHKLYKMSIYEKK